MKLKEFSDNLTQLMKDRPETRDFLVVSSKDDEGNGFNLVSYEPSVGEYNKEEKDFYQEHEPRSNAVCIN